eukprot:TRINITY_DN9577_c0_g2_i3.p1 TRINITY_DN9577_c0_g2~~TRINITY_DN9577_c0_g2_i3.p1  ORF type:complete len:328 (+),score=61.30 TRINITY_DN9577_c0_g2_i3:82-1065(+)
MRPTLLTSKPVAGLPLKAVPTTSACCDLEEDDLVMFNNGYRDQYTNPGFYVPKLVIPLVESSPSSNSMTWNDGNDFGDSPRDLLFDKLDGSPGDFTFSSNLYASAHEAEGVCSTGTGNTVNVAAEASDESPGEGKHRRRRRRRAEAAAAAAAASAPSPVKTMSQRGNHQGDGAPPDLVENTPASATAVAAEGPPVWPENATTVMLRNIPNRYIAEELLAEIMEEGFEGQIDFFYLPIDFTTKRNRGYAFINFHTPIITTKFVTVFDDRRLTRYATKKVLQVTPAATQGFDANVKAYVRRDAQRIVNPWFRPMIFGRSTDNGDILSGS